MGLADNGVTRDVSEMFRDLAGTQAILPEPFQFVDACLCPFHRQNPHPDGFSQFWLNRAASHNILCLKRLHPQYPVWFVAATATPNLWRESKASSTALRTEKAFEGGLRL